MTTPIFIRVLMMAPYFAVRIFAALTRRDVDGRGATALGLGVLFLFTGIGHFMQTEPMAQMLPPWVPERILLVYVTGVLECAIAVGFLVPKSRQCTGGVVAGMLILFFAPINHISMGDYAWGPIYLLIRAPLQVIIVFWVY
jgi:uncharacterized membrane protein